MQLTGELYEQVLRAIRPDRRRTNEARRLARVSVAFVLELRRVDPAAPEGMSGALRVRVRDLSPTGIGFISEAEFRAGERVVLHLPREGSTPLRIASVVRFCFMVGHRLWRVGVHFVEDSQGTDYTRRAAQVPNAVPT